MKGYKRKKKAYIKYILICVVILVTLIFTAYSLKKERNLTFIESAIKDISVFISDTLYAPIRFFKDKIEVYKEKEDIYQKYKELQSAEDDIDQKNSRIAELEKENQELKDSLGLEDSLSEYETINATVVSRNVGYWYDKLTINKGKKDGIESKMAVVINNGIIGYISETSNFSSNVQLLTTKNLKNKISVKIDLGNNEYANGLLSEYDSEKSLYRIEGISYSGTIPENSRVTTTGLSDNFPSGILIGYVNTTTTDNFDLGKIVEVVPSVDFNRISYVTVLKRKAITE